MSTPSVEAAGESSGQVIPGAGCLAPAPPVPVEEGGLVLYGQCCVLYPFRLLLDVSRRLEDPRQRVL